MLLHCFPLQPSPSLSVIFVSYCPFFPCLPSPPLSVDSDSALQAGVTLNDEAEYVTAIRTTHKIRGDPIAPLHFLANPHTALMINSSLSIPPLGFAFNPVSVTRTKKTDSSSGALVGDRALISLVNNTLEIYHINSPDSVPIRVPVTPSTPSSSSAKKEGKKKGKPAKAKEDVGDGADEEEDEEEEEEVVAIELIQSSRGELVLKQAVIDLHGHR
jgi:hypothetical protein